MPNPTQKLYRLLAESWHHTSGIRGLHKDMTAGIPQQVDRLQGELAQLRAHIFGVGVGVDEEAEDRYLGILHDLRQMGQFYDHGQRIPESHPIVDDGLSKALDYGRMLLDVYGGGILAKAAQGDIATHARRLGRYRDPAAIAMQKALLGLPC